MGRMARHGFRVHAYGGPEVLTWEALPEPPPGPGQVALRHAAVGVNFIDIYHRTGLYPLPGLPHGIGMEAAGVVEAVGVGVEGLRPGDRVGYAAGPPGAYATGRTMAADKLVPLPEDVDDVTAAAVLLKGMTAEYLARRVYPAGPGTVALVHAAAGGVGLILCQWLRSLGARVLGTAGTDAKARLALAHGCEHAIVYARDDFAERVRQLTDGKGVHVVYDSVGKATVAGSLSCLRPRGMLVLFGNASGAPGPIDPLELGRRGSLFLTRPSLMDYTAGRNELLASARALFDVLRRGAVQLPTPRTRPLQEAPRAQAELEARATTGCTVLLP
jgi:NADPH2:quinone reductase